MREAIEDAVHGALVRWSNGEQPKPIREMVADAILALLPATPEGNLRKGLFNARPQFAGVESGPEPSVRELVSFYYRTHQMPNAAALTDLYVSMLAATPLHDLESREGWQDIATAPRDAVIVGLRVNAAEASQPAFVGQLYDLFPDCIVDRWTGKWVRCSHWMPLPASPSIQEKGE